MQVFEQCVRYFLNSQKHLFSDLQPNYEQYKKLIFKKVLIKQKLVDQCSPTTLVQFLVIIFLLSSPVMRVNFITAILILSSIINMWIPLFRWQEKKKIYCNYQYCNKWILQQLCFTKWLTLVLKNLRHLFTFLLCKNIKVRTTEKSFNKKKFKKKKREE